MSDVTREPTVPGAEPGTGGGAPDAAAFGAALVEAPSPDVADAADAPRLPGEHRGGFQRLPTEPLDVAITGTAPVATWIEPQRQATGIAGWALFFSVAGLLVSLVVGWGFPLGLAASIASIVALRRPLESRTVAIWALVLGVISILYSTGWLLWAAHLSAII